MGQLRPASPAGLVDPAFAEKVRVSLGKAFVGSTVARFIGISTGDYLKFDGDDIVGAAPPGSGGSSGVVGAGTTGQYAKWASATALNGQTGIPATDLTGTVASARVSGAYTGITGLGTITAGVWQGTQVADAYIASAASWNARVLRTGDDMSGPLRILNVLSDKMLEIGDGSNPVGATKGVLTIAGDFTNKTGRDLVVLAGTMDMAGSPRAISSYPGMTATANGQLAVSIAAGADIHKGAHTGLTYYGFHSFNPTADGAGTIADAYGLYIDTIAVGTTNYSLYTGTALSHFGGDVNVASGKVYKVNGTQVVGAQGAAVADATGAGDVVAQLNSLLARVRTHGLIA